MAIVFHPSSQNFHLYNDKISYIMTILKNGQMGQLYFGKRIQDKEDFNDLLELAKRPMSPCIFEGDSLFSLEHIKQEYPAYGRGDMRYPAYEILQKNGSHITEFQYVSHKIYKGKPQLDGLPATYVEQEDEAETLEITLKDDVIQTKIILRYTIYEAYGVITRNVRFEHEGEGEICLTKALSFNLDLPDREYEMVQLTGAWSRERHVQTRKLSHGVHSIHSMRGNSSSQYNPFFALKRPETTENLGEVIGVSLVYSGNFLGQVEVDTYDVTRVSMGIHPQGFLWNLKQGETFETPEAVVVYSDRGLNGMSQTFHSLYRKRLARGIWREKDRPILINNWEGTYMDFTEDKIIQLATTAKELGIELFVLDDGWFGKRNTDTSSLGDWYPNLSKLPSGIAGLSEKIECLGMKFGLWFEPEMVNKESDLYEAHPDWILATPDRGSCHGRNQFVLDFSKKEVVDHIFEQMDKVLSTSKISYVKWDMNRCMTEVYSLGRSPEEQGMVAHKYILGVYELYERLITKYPHILFESCASGGGRFDAGMLYYAPQTWTSDDTDAVERLKIQYGTSFVYPISSIGSHVSASPNHQALRVTPLNTRANVAYFGTFGYELDLDQLSEHEKQEVVRQIEHMKTYRHLIQSGTFYRLISPFETDCTGWMVVSEDKKEAMVGFYRILRPVNHRFQRMKLQGLEEKTVYQIMEIGKEEIGEKSGDELMYVGFSVSDSSSGETHERFDGTNGDFQSRIYYLRNIEEN